MGRFSTGAITTGEVIRLELSFLLRQKYIRKNANLTVLLSWTGGSTIGFSSVYNKEEKYIRLTYTFKSGNNEGKSLDYRIYLATLPSNLGKGEVPYFICPSSGRLARVLYLCYGSPIFKSRTAYQNRIYYSCQNCSKLEYHNTRYWELEKKTERIRAIIKKKHYKGQATRLGRRLQFLDAKKYYFEAERWNHVPKSVLKSSSGMALLSELKGGK